MIGWAILGIVIIVALASGIVWWFCADTRRSRARRRLVPGDDGDSGVPDCEWSVAAIAARVERERDDSIPQGPNADVHGLAPDRARERSPDESDRSDNAPQFPPQNTAARQRPYIQPSPRPRRPPPPPSDPDLMPTPHLGLLRLNPTDLALLQRVHEGLKHL